MRNFAMFVSFLIVLGTASSAEAKPNLGARFTMNVSPGMDSGAEFGLGAEFDLWSDESWMLAGFGAVAAYNPWDGNISTQGYLNFMQSLTTYFGVGISPFAYFPDGRTTDLNLGVSGVIDFLVKAVDFALCPGVILYPEITPSFTIQIGFNLPMWSGQS